MASKIKVDQIQTADGTGTIALQNQLSGMTTASLPALGSAQMPTGSVVQVVHASTNSSVVMSSGTHVDTGLTATITPTSSSNKILVSVHQNGLRKHSNHANNDITAYILRGSTNIAHIAKYLGFTQTSLNLYIGNVSGEMLDSPATTSATTYKTTFANPDGGGSGGTITAQEGSARSTITLTEIVG
jgi:hypothetical protein